MQNRHQILGFGIAQVDNLGIAAAIHRGIQVGGQGPQPQPRQLVPTQQNAIGAFVRHHAWRRADGGGRIVAGLALFQGGEYPHHLGGRGVPQGHDLDFLVAGQIDPTDDAGNTFDIGGTIGNDQNIGRRVGRQMPLWRDQRA